MKAIYKNFTVSASFTGSKKAPWAGGPENWNHHTITVVNNDFTTGGKTTFDFWASIAHPRLETEYDVLNALYCFVSDALCGMRSFEDFCWELGYDEDSRSAEKTWRACIRSAEKWRRISMMDESETCDFLNELQEIAG